jgi:hypothetical protein
MILRGGSGPHSGSLCRCRRCQDRARPCPYDRRLCPGVGFGTETFLIWVPLRALVSHRSQTRSGQHVLDHRGAQLGAGCRKGRLADRPHRNRRPSMVDAGSSGSASLRANSSGNASNSAVGTASHSVGCSLIVRKAMSSICAGPKGRAAATQPRDDDQHAGLFQGEVAKLASAAWPHRTSFSVLPGADRSG